MRWIRSVTLAALSISSLALAQPARKPLKQAVEALDDAASKARKAGGQCKATIYDAADDLSDRADALKRDGNANATGRLQQDVANLANNASWSGCPDKVVNALHRASDALDDARRAMWEGNNGNGNGPPPNSGNGNNGYGNGNGSDDDGQYHVASMAPLQVQVRSMFENEPAVQVSVPELTIRQMQGQNFYLGARFRSFQGNWSEWVTTQQWSVPSDPFVWRNAFTHYFRYSTLAEEDFADGRYVARISLFDSRGRELAFRETSFTAKVPNLPRVAVMPTIQVQPVLPTIPVPPIQQPLPRDCGTGADVGCGYARDGRYAMEAQQFANVMRSLQATTSDVARVQVLNQTWPQNYVTAIQFGMMLDTITGEQTRLQAAQAGMYRVVNVQNAAAYADHFRNPPFRQQYVAMCGGGMQQPPQYVPPQPGYQQPPQPGYQQPQRDCGTGQNDIGCTMTRNGRWAVDGTAWPQMLASLRGTMNELVREDNLKSMFGNQGVTAIQMGLLMDLFNNEITRLDVAKFLASRVVNPQHAIGYSSKFQNSLLGQEYLQVLGQQR